MRYISFYNVKGGTAKTHSAISFAIILAKKYNKRVLFVDIDPQSSASMSLGCFDESEKEALSIADVLTAKEPIVEKAIQHCKYGFDVIPSSFDLLNANISVPCDVMQPQQFRLKKQFKCIEDKYDFCIFDHSPYPSVTTANALNLTDDVLVPIKLGYYGLAGLGFVIKSVVEAKENNPKLVIRGCFATIYDKRTKLNSNGLTELQEVLSPLGLPVYNTYIRNTCKVGESEAADPLIIYSPNSTASEDYYNLVEEYLKSIS